MNLVYECPLPDPSKEFSPADADSAANVAAFNGRENRPMKSTNAKKTWPATPFIFMNISSVAFDGSFGSGRPFPLMRIFYATNLQKPNEEEG